MSMRPLLLSHIDMNTMSDVTKQVEHLLGSKNPIKTLTNLLGGLTVSLETKAELENVVNILEIHEHEIRSLRQSLYLRLRQHSLNYHKEYLIKKNIE